ncbi:MAG TPA: dihydrofolate reductase family protein [Solirubrobacteraceae bacterium]|jgi:riboflavin-specific deaminase-like protein|nr:dihydrofolate reductase family protein [Solirubrobacteraceae bacterium]
MPNSPEQFAAQLIEELDLSERARAGARERPYVALNMISTADGRATLSGRSGEIGDEADKRLFHGLRTLVDGVMVGAGTVRAEGYHRLIRDPAARKRRRERGLAEEPLACIVSGRLALDGRVPLLADPQARVAIVTTSQASLPDGCRAQIEYVRCARDGQIDLVAAMRELRARFDITTLLCEGGPHLNAHLLAAGLVDELFLSLAPTLAGGDATSESLRIVSGVDLTPPVAMELLSTHEHESHLFLRYRVPGGSSTTSV